MNNAEIREMTDAEIFDRIDENQVILNRKKLDHAVSPLENPNEIQILRREIARLKTEIRRREIEASQVEQLKETIEEEVEHEN